MKKILYVASRISHITNFHMPYISYMKDKGYIVHVLSEGSSKINVDKIYNIPFEKKITSIKNLNTIKKIRNILEEEKYDLIITNTTLASFIVRISKQTSKIKNYGKLVNISHGYLFSENTNIIKKNIYILAEKLCVSSTNKLITMNQEDYELAKKYKLGKGDIVKINGMGIPNPPIFEENIKQETRKKFNISNEDYLMTYVGELSKRKNQIFLIKNFKYILELIPNAKLILAGNGSMYGSYEKEITEKKLTDTIYLVGHITNVKELIYSSDIIISSSKSEGLPFNIMEAMSIGVPVLASNIKGHKDLIKDGYNGFLFDLESKNNSLIIKIKELLNNKNIEKIKNNEKEYVKNFMLRYIFNDIIKQIDI